MSSEHLKLQFQRLYQHYSGNTTETNLQDIADILLCTRRNVRMVINKMVEKSWIDWQPSVGRGKQSKLIFNCSDNDLKFMQARKLVTDSKLERALTILEGDTDKLAQLIQEQLGIAHHHGQQIVRIPCFENLGNLNPIMPVRPLEYQLLRYIFSGLTRINVEKGEVIGDIAHSWEMVTPRHWRFYIRQGIRFHDGSFLLTSDIVTTFENIKALPLFNHIDEVISPLSNTVDFYLNRDDCRLDRLLANIVAVIQSEKYTNHAQFPIGTGPYKVVTNEKQTFKLAAFESYFGYRALTDSIEIWMLNHTVASSLKPLLIEQLNDALLVSKQLVLDQGCYFLLVNRESGLARHSDWLQYFQSKFSCLSLSKHIDNEKVNEFQIINAYGLLPGYFHIVQLNEEIKTPISKRVVTLAIEKDQPISSYFSILASNILGKDGIKVKVVEMTYQDFIGARDAEKIDIWFCHKRMTRVADSEMLSWFYDTHHLKNVMPNNEFSQLDNIIDNWRTDSECDFPNETFAKYLVQCGQVLPLFHQWVNKLEQSTMMTYGNTDIDFSTLWINPKSISVK